MKTGLSPSRRASAIQPSPIRRLFDARRPTSINLGLGEPAIPVPLELLDAGFARYRRARPGYTANAGMPELRERIAAHYGRPRLAAAANVIVTAGLEEALFSTLIAIGDPGDEVILPDPCFLAYRTVAELVGLRIVSVPSRRAEGFALDVEGLAAAITPRTRAIILNSPSNPTGRVDSSEELRALVAATETAGVWLVSDEVYREIWFGAEPPPSIASFSDRAIVLGALSKSCSMTGFRLGFVIAPEPVARAVAPVHQFNVTCAPTISQHLALEVFEHPEWLGVLRPPLARACAAMRAAVDAELGMPYVTPQGGFFLFLDVGAVTSRTLELAERILEEADVVTVPGSAFGGNGEGFLRLSFAGGEDQAREGIRRLAGFFHA